MTKRTAPLRPGNDGQWFLDVVATTAVSPPTAPQSAPAPPVPPSNAAGSTKVAATAPAASLDPVPAPNMEATGTTKTVERMWQDKTVNPIATGVPTQAGGPFADWTPEELSKAVGSRRNYRWSVVAALVIVGGLLGTLLVWVPTISEHAASERTADYAASLVEMRRRLPGAQEVLGSVTDLALDVPADAAATVAGLSGAAQDTSELAAKDLPATFPLIPRSPIEELQPHREQIGLIASDATSIASRLDAIYGYRTAAVDVLALPPLPTQTNTAAINELSVVLATLLADATGTLSALPADDAMAAHRTRIGEVVDRLGEWQVEYLDALRREDVEAATSLVDEAALWEQRLDTAMRAGLGAARAELDTELVRLATDIERVLAGLPT
jgi:hypothetical protein